MALLPEQNQVIFKTLGLKIATETDDKHLIGAICGFGIPINSRRC